MEDRFKEVILLSPVICSMMVVMREYLDSNKSREVRSGDFAANIAASMSSPLNPCKTKNFNLVLGLVGKFVCRNFSIRELGCPSRGSIWLTEQ